MPLLWIELGLLTVLVSLLLWSRWRQLKRQLRKEISLRGHGFDTSQVKRRLNTLRKDYRTAVPIIPKTPGHALFVSTVQKSLRQLSYFQSLAQTTAKPQPEHAEEGR